MKAWEVTTKYTDCGDIVFANTRNEAKKKLINGETALNSTLANVDSVEYIDVRATRLAELDDMEHVPLVQLAEAVILKCAWTWTIVSGGKTWNADNFDKEEFEKEWHENDY